jgi:hypothetical protein
MPSGSGMDPRVKPGDDERANPGSKSQRLEIGGGVSSFVVLGLDPGLTRVAMPYPLRASDGQS